MALKNEIEKRRTFAIISHPDAGKTTLTEKLLLYGGAIQMAGSVKAKRSKKFATSDWMELEKQRGISVTSSVMNFPYGEHLINLIDTPGHQDFSEDTYRTLTAVDSALMLIDAANGVETQTKKLFEVCSGRQTPITTFINKMDREGREPFELLEEIETTLGIQTYAATWPIGSGDRFCGVYHRAKSAIILYQTGGSRSEKIFGQNLSLDSKEVDAALGVEAAEQLREDIALLDGAGESFSEEAYLAGRLAPVFFGSALHTFGVETLLDHLVERAPAPLPRKAAERLVEPDEKKFSGFVFKIQANMDPSHRDRVAFVRICSGQFERGMKAHHVRHNKLMRLGRPTQFMAQDRSLVDSAYAGDIVGVHDPGAFKIGDTITEGEALHFTDIPVFAPEHFVRVELKDPLKMKQVRKGLEQLSEEGAVQLFRSPHRADQILGVVGTLQIDVVKYRLHAEYGVNVEMRPLPYTTARWLRAKDDAIVEKFVREQGQNVCFDIHNQPAILLDHDWRIKFHQDRHPDLQFVATAEAAFG